MRFQTVIFDFDGTIADTAAGIFESVQYALEKIGMQSASQETLRKFIGPPLIFSFQQYIGLSNAQAQRAVEYYRENYAAGGKFKLTFYNGIEPLLGWLHRRGIQTCLASAKPDLFIQQILQHFQAQNWFDYARGMPMSHQSADKSGIIQEVIHLCGDPQKERILMVGDTKYDILGAKTLGIFSMGARYGYGSADELREAGADYLADTPQDIQKILQSL